MLDFTEIESSMTIATTAACGEYTTLTDTIVTNVILEGGGSDQDGDSVLDINDRCPDGIGEDEGWKSNSNSDKDEDGCRDNDEDDDDEEDSYDDDDDDDNDEE